jgi:hypothetical protein
VKYQPKRSSKRWLRGAPDYVLAIYDGGVQFSHDRYTVMLCGIFWEASMGRNVMYVSVGESGCYSSGEIPSSNRSGKKMRWVDLPQDVINGVLEWAKPDEEGFYVRTRNELKLCGSEFEARMYAATVKGEVQYHD